MDDPLEGHVKYRTVRALNAGSFGQVVLAKNLQTNELVAIKLLQRSQNLSRAAQSAKYWEREVIAHFQLYHPHIVRLYEIFLTSLYLAIAMEFVPGGTLLEYMNKTRGLEESEARVLFQQLIVAVDYCHRVGVVNRDIKLENTLLSGTDPQLLKLIDFGYAKSNDYSLPKSLVGTKGYTAPEIVLSRNSTYDAKKADIWSCGVVLFIMLFYAYPFERRTDKAGAEGLEQVLKRIVEVDYMIPVGKRHISPEAQDLIKSIFQPDPLQRITIPGIMAHPWFKVGFTPEMESLNERAIQHSKRLVPFQSSEEIEAILRAAVKPNPVFDFEMDSNDVTEYDSGLTEMVSQEMQSYDSYNE